MPAAGLPSSPQVPLSGPPGGIFGPISARRGDNSPAFARLCPPPRRFSYLSRISLGTPTGHLTDAGAEGVLGGAGGAPCQTSPPLRAHTVARPPALGSRLSQRVWDGSGSYLPYLTLSGGCWRRLSL